MSGRRGSGSGPFLMEMILVSGFFIICAALCVTVFVKADSTSRRARDINQAVLAAETLAEEIKAGELEALGSGLPVPDRDFGKSLLEWENDEQRARRELITSAGDFHSYAPVWDEEWNRYGDAGELHTAGKKLAYAAEVLCGTVDNMQMTEIAVMRYGSGSRDKGTVLYVLNADQYIKP